MRRGHVCTRWVDVAVDEWSVWWQNVTVGMAVQWLCSDCEDGGAVAVQ